MTTGFRNYSIIQDINYAKILMILITVFKDLFGSWQPLLASKYL